jgi:hypothetical protein
LWGMGEGGDTGGDTEVINPRTRWQPRDFLLSVALLC